MKLSAVLLTGVLAAATVPAGESSFRDAFVASAPVPERRAMRGDWNIAEGVARCTQDDLLYKKYKNHGPILFYDFPTTDATFRCVVKPTGCQSLVFTLNGTGGHVFRLIARAKGTTLLAFPPDSEKPVETGSRPEWKLREGEWTEIVVTLKGSKAIVSLAGREPITVEHDTYGTPKVNFSVGFAFGTLEVKGIEVAK